MFKTLLEALKEQTRQIGQNPAASYGAAMTAMVVFLLWLSLNVGGKLLDEKDKRILEKDGVIGIITTMGNNAATAQERERIARDTARMWETRYNELYRITVQK